MAILDKKWRLLGYDTFEGGDAFYTLPGSFATEEEAIEAAKKRLAEIDQSQPSEESGGQDEDGIQDQVFIVRPDRSRYRFIS